MAKRKYHYLPPFVTRGCEAELVDCPITGRQVPAHRFRWPHPLELVAVANGQLVPLCTPNADIAVTYRIPPSDWRTPMLYVLVDPECEELRYFNKRSEHHKRMYADDLHLTYRDVRLLNLATQAFAEEELRVAY